jgi:hypothetical protein
MTDKEIHKLAGVWLRFWQSPDDECDQRETAFNTAMLRYDPTQAECAKAYLTMRQMAGDGHNCMVIRYDGAIATPDDPEFKLRTVQ